MLESWLDRALRQIDLHIQLVPNDGLELAILNTVQGFYHFEIFIKRLVFGNLALAWGMVLLIAKQYVIQQRTITRQEAASNVERHGVPQLRFLRLLINLEISELVDFVLKLNYEPNLCARAKVADYEEANDVQKRVAIEALFILPYLRQLLKLQG